MPKIKKPVEKTPPLPIDKPATYENKTKAGEDNVGHRKSKHQSTTQKDKASPQKTREKMEMDPDKTEIDPGMTKR